MLINFCWLMCSAADVQHSQIRCSTGRAYNTWPLMDGKVMPVEDMFPLEPVWRNFFETTATVQVRQRLSFV